jgi:hypothetical protein
MAEKGDSFTIARVVLQGDENRASIVMLKDPLRLCEQQDLSLAFYARNLRIPQVKP